jgi:hypothetical protein
MANDVHECGHCGMWHAGPCARIKAMEYYPDGTMKRVEYYDARPAMQHKTAQPMSDTASLLGMLGH